MEIKYNTKQLIAVEYPGTVVNLENMTKTLGGESKLFSMFNTPTKRLELKFRPEDPYCKCVHGDRFNTTNILLKIVKKTKKSKKDTAASSDNVKFEVEFLGAACTTYKFKTLVDFQVLPAAFDENKQEFKSLLSDIVPTKLHPASWLDQDIELFLPPLMYSRFDLPQNGYMDIINKSKIDPSVEARIPANVIGRSRKRRAGFAVFTTFESTDACNEPQTEAIKQLQLYPIEIDIKKRLEVLFNNERPIWTRNGLLTKLKCDRNRLKHALPCTAYYFTNGPWRASWVKFGYNPRKDIAAKIYQIMDLRINPNIPVDDKLNRRRQAYYTLPNKNSAAAIKVPKIRTDLLAAPSTKEDESDDKIRVLPYEYFPGKLPVSRQCFFQLCDIYLDSVQELVHQNDGHEQVCLEKDGWCELGTLERCRELLIADIIKTVKESKDMDS
ncbi:general transcription factor 3C polypeptide 5-like [Uloborus diversus]|uniref:general transcription factor 3C polypeptide 5-like n=1 Tax=Uloborus diversus TaxID=327109 RepID=UPI00240A4730|nr:general transcription factor 3C polypeptide 5-like [Uloborus diversus]